MKKEIYKIFSDEKKVLITGGAGFIGGCLIRRILNNTNSKIFNIDKISYASDLSWLENCKNIHNHNLIKIDLKNKDQVFESIRKSDPDIIFNLAAESHVDRSIDDPFPFIESNILGTYNLLNAVKLHYQNLNKNRKKSFRFLHISTDEVFGSLGNTGLFNESTPYDPRSPYSASKAASDHLVNSWHHTYEIPTLITNCSNNFGPFQYPEKLIPLVIDKALKENDIPIYGNGLNVRDWLFVEDHIEALLKVISFGEIGKSYCIGGFGERSNLEIVNNVCEILDNSLKKDFSHKSLIKFVKDRPGHDKRYSINSKLIQKELNWEPKNNLINNLEFTVKWYLNNRNWLKKTTSLSKFKGSRMGL